MIHILITFIACDLLMWAIIMQVLNLQVYSAINQ